MRPAARVRSALRHMRLLALLVRLSIQNDAAYRFDFVMRVLTAVLQLGGELVMLWTIFANTRSLAGWSVPQVIVLLGVFRIMSGLIGMCVAPNMRRIMEDIRQGTLDFVLLKPVSAQFYASFRQIVIWRLVDLVLGGTLAVIGAVPLAGQLGVLSVVMFLVTLACGATIVYSIWLAIATTVFWFTRIDNIEMIFWNMYEAGRYPIDIYHPWVRWALTFILPLAFLITVPAGALAGRASLPLMLSALVAAPIVLLVASAYWRFGLRHYSGASA